MLEQLQEAKDEFETLIFEYCSSDMFNELDIPTILYLLKTSSHLSHLKPILLLYQTIITNIQLSVISAAPLWISTAAIRNINNSKILNGLNNMCSTMISRRTKI